MTMPRRIPVTHAQIADVVRAFYARVRADAVLGPIFAAHIDDWQSHESKIVRFWSHALLYDRSYSGNPMRVHMDAGNVGVAHFDIWLPLFDAVLAEQLPADISRSWSALAHRIGQGLRFGLQSMSTQKGAPPDLRGSI